MDGRMDGILQLARWLACSGLGFGFGFGWYILLSPVWSGLVGTGTWVGRWGEEACELVYSLSLSGYYYIVSELFQLPTCSLACSLLAPPSASYYYYSISLDFCSPIYLLLLGVWVGVEE